MRVKFYSIFTTSYYNHIAPFYYLYGTNRKSFSVLTDFPLARKMSKNVFGNKEQGPSVLKNERLEGSKVLLFRLI